VFSPVFLYFFYFPQSFIAKGAPGVIRKKRRGKVRKGRNWPGRLLSQSVASDCSSLEEDENWKAPARGCLLLCLSQSPASDCSSERRVKPGRLLQEDCA
jgi:hypothetical protein